LRGRLPGPLGGQRAAIRMAVLPFANLTGDPEQEYLSDGLTQELISQLGRMHPQGLSVIARTSVMRFKKTDTPVDQIGRELGVGYVLEGSARREGAKIRVTAELVHVGNQAQIWAETYERELSGLLALQSEVARRVTEALALKLMPAEQARLASARAVDPEAYDAYLKGTYRWQKLTPAEIGTAQRYFELALAKDPSYAAAHAGLAWVWAVRQQMSIVAPAEAGPRAREAALRAIALDDNSAPAHEALAVVMTWTDWDWKGAESEWRRALALDPNAPNAHAYYAHYLAVTGRTGEAVSHGERALELDPFNSLFRGMHAVVLYFDRHYDDAIAMARSALALRPDEGIAWSALGYAFITKGMHDEQLALQRERLAKDPGRLAALEQGLAEGGYEGAQRRLGDLLAERYEKARGAPGAGTLTFALPWLASLRYRDAGDYDKALDWLEKAFEARDPNLPYAAASPLFDAVRSGPRFQSLRRRMGLPVGS
jgi:adenylate cyclase